MKQEPLGIFNSFQLKSESLLKSLMKSRIFDPLEYLLKISSLSMQQEVIGSSLKMSCLRGDIIEAATTY